MSTETGSRYWIFNWIYAAISDNCLILLDGRRDKYYILSIEELSVISGRVVMDEKIKNIISHKCAKHDKSHEIIARLMEKNILTSDPLLGKTLGECEYENPVSPFEHIECDQWPEIHWRHIVSVITSGVIAALIIHFIPIRIILWFCKLSPLKQYDDNIANNQMTLARIYKRLRPLMAKSRICLYDTIAFALFCRFHGEVPSIIFGVKGEPFQAHCWAQCGGWVLNDVPQNIRQYKPIMVI